MADPPVVLRPATPRRRSGFDGENLLGIAGLLVMLAVAGVGAKLFHDQWWQDTVNGRKKPPVNDRLIERPSPPPPVPDGGGRKARPKPDPEPVSPRSAREPRGDQAKAFSHLKSALANVRKGFFNEADEDAAKALMAAPDCDEAQAMRFAVAYVRQYPKLADEALAALDENDVVDLGPKYGPAAFISRDGDGSIRFQVNGGPRAFSPAELAGMSDARFRIAKSFLDGAHDPANDLILGACHFVKKLDGDGNVNPAAAIDAARERWRRAAVVGDELSRGHADMLLELLDRLPELEKAE